MSTPANRPGDPRRRMRGAQLGVIVSDHLYAEAAQHAGLMNPAAYTPLELTCKETCSRAWLWLPAESRSR